MKRLLLLTVLILITVEIVLFGVPIRYEYNTSVTSTTAVQVAPKRVNRRLVGFINYSNGYDIYVSTAVLNQANRTALGTRVTANGGWYVDDSYCYISSWYAISDGGTTMILHTIETE